MCDLNTDSSLYIFDVNEDLKSDCVEAEVPAGAIFEKESSLSERYCFLVGTPRDRATGNDEKGFRVRWILSRRRVGNYLDAMVA